MIWGPAVSRHLSVSVDEVRGWSFPTLIQAHAVMDYCVAAERVAREDADAAQTRRRP